MAKFKTNTIISLILFFSLCSSSSVFGALTCEGLLQNTKIQFNVFTGYTRDSDFVSEHLEYPSNWSYRQLGGEHGQLEGERLKGATAETYLATRPDGSKVTLKAYAGMRSLERDFAGYENLKFFVPESDHGFMIPKVTRSLKNSFILEIEYFEGLDFAEFIEKNKERSAELISSYNLSVAILEAQFDMEPYDIDKITVSSVKLKEFEWDDLEGGSIRIDKNNILVIKDPKNPGKFRFVIIDPE